LQVTSELRLHIDFRRAIVFLLAVVGDYERRDGHFLVAVDQLLRFQRKLQLHFENTGGCRQRKKSRCRKNRHAFHRSPPGGFTGGGGIGCIGISVGGGSGWDASTSGGVGTVAGCAPAVAAVAGGAAGVVAPAP